MKSFMSFLVELNPVSKHYLKAGPVEGNIFDEVLSFDVLSENNNDLLLCNDI